MNIIKSYIMPRVKLYNEDTEVVSFRVPMSRAKKFKEDGNKKLLKWQKKRNK